jgi:hypothetical protein
MTEFGVSIVQTEDFVVDRKDTIGTVANHFRNSIIASSKREANGAHEHIGFAAGGCTTGYQPEGTRKSNTHRTPRSKAAPRLKTKSGLNLKGRIM